MKILILIPLWKRPEVVDIVFRNLALFRRKVKWEIEVLAILCPDDPNLKALELLCKKYDVYKCYFKNSPLGMKMNAGINFAMKKFKFDYLMNFGSDDLIHPRIELLYKKAFKSKVQVFGIDSLFFYDLLTKKTFYFKTYTYRGMVVGAGRMIRRDVLESMQKKNIGLYEDEIERSCDGNSSERMKLWLKIPNTVINSGEFPYIVDIKTNTNINHITHIELSNQSQIEYFPDNYLDQYFKL
jgi:hypothetical protein